MVFKRKKHLFFVVVVNHLRPVRMDYRAVCTTRASADQIAAGIRAENPCTVCRSTDCDFSVDVEEPADVVDVDNHDEVATYVVNYCVPPTVRTAFRGKIVLDNYYPGGIVNAA